MSVPTLDEPKKPTQESTRDVNWSDFREHLATAEKDGKRRWIYPKKPCGSFYQARTYVSWLLLTIMFVGPFVRINGNPLLMFNIVERRFSILGQIFWPQDSVIFAVAMLLFFTSIIIFSAAFGRLWCGWTCPQTLLMEMVFRKIEYWIEGDSHHQRALASSPWDATKIRKKVSKHLIFFGLSFLIGNTLLSYIIGSDELFHIIADNPANHVKGLTFMVLFTVIFYLIFARFREQACTFICPYGRFQSAILDENTIVVAYDHKRGEGRAPLQRDQPPAARRASGLGDCVSCNQCVSVCPTGIDIRNGTQMECVNCTACIDACDAVMDKVGSPRGLIRYASLNGIEKGKPFEITPRMKGYAAILVTLVTALTVLVFGRSEIETTLLRAPGSLFQIAPNGKISNLYTVQLANKTGHDIPVQLKLENVEGKITIMSGSMRVPKEKLTEAPVLVELDPKSLTGAVTQLKIGVYSEGRLLETVKSVFMSPRDGLNAP